MHLIGGSTVVRCPILVREPGSYELSLVVDVAGSQE